MTKCGVYGSYDRNSRFTMRGPELLSDETKARRKDLDFCPRGTLPTKSSQVDDDDDDDDVDDDDDDDDFIESENEG